MNEGTLLFIIAAASVINAAALVAVVVVVLQLRREIDELKEEFTQKTGELLSELLDLTRESKGMVKDVRGLTTSGKNIAEKVATALIMRRISPGWVPKKNTLKLGLQAAREGVGFLRRWLSKQKPSDRLPEKQSSERLPQKQEVDSADGGGTTEETRGGFSD